MFKRRRNSKKLDEDLVKETNIKDEDERNSLSRSCDSFSTNNLLSSAFSHSSNLSNASSTRHSSTILNMFSKTVSQMRNVFSNSSTLNQGRSSTADILEARERQKKQMEILNDHLANFIEKVRFLEAQNRKLSVDIEHFRRFRGEEMLSIYETELFQARKVADEATKRKTELEAEFVRLRNELAYQRNKYEEQDSKRDVDKEIIDDLIIKLCDIECDINLVRRRNDIIENDVNRLKTEQLNLQILLQNVRNDVNRETMASLEQQSQVSVINEEMDFLRKCSNQETKELRSMVLVDVPEINGECFKNELASAIREIRIENDTVCAQTKTDFESQYQMKVKEIQFASSIQKTDNKCKDEESKTLRVQLNEFRNKMLDVEMKNSILEKQIQDLMYRMEDDQQHYESTLNDRNCDMRKVNEEQKYLIDELNKLLDKNHNLDSEIAVYRKILEGEAVRDTSTKV